jgi:hypothetical protein
MLPDMKDLTYEERLRKLKLPSLRYRRLRGDMIETFKIVNEIYDRRTIVLYCIELYCIVLYCIVLYCIVLFQRNDVITLVN